MIRPALLLASLLPAIVFAAPLHVFVSVLPLQTFVERIGGEHVDVRVMVRPGYSPATYDPTPQQITALSQTDLFIRAGLPFEQAWMARIRSANPGMPILDARGDIKLREFQGHAHAEHAHAGPQPDGQRTATHDTHHADPHVWTDPRLVAHMAGLIRDGLVELDPARRAVFIRNHAAFIDELDRLDRDIRALLDPLSHRRFLVFHPAWGYFADAYGLVQVAIEHDGKQPGARSLAALIEQARQERIRIVFVQPQFDRRQARQVAEAIGGEVIAADPLAPDYIDNLRRVAQRFAEALQP